MELWCRWKTRRGEAWLSRHNASMSENFITKNGEAKVIEALKSSHSLNEALVKLGRTPGGKASNLLKAFAIERNIPLPEKDPEVDKATHKRCAHCKRVKTHEEFNRRGETGRQPKCRPCDQKLAMERYYDGYGERVLEMKRKRRYDNAQAVLTHLGGKQCIDCGIDDVRVLEFDHVRGTKVKNVSQMYDYSLKTIFEEIEKCEVRCANCHRIKTCAQLGWARGLVAEID